MIQSFFQRFLAAERNLSANTVLSYRDTMKLFLRFVSATRGRPPDALEIQDMDVDVVRAFLDWGEATRGNKPRTRNQRLAALKTFFRYIAMKSPENLDRCRQVREIPTKRFERPEPEFLEQPEVNALLNSVEPNSPAGLRDRALLLVLYNTGARVQEVVTLDVGDVRLDPPPMVRLHGKGRKIRSCPIWAETATMLHRLITARPQPLPPSAPVFLNASGLRLSRSGISHILRRAAAKAGLPRLSRARRLTPHVIRHTTAMHLLQSKVDIATIAAWLGHSQLSTTHGYLQIDLRMKQAAIEAASTPALRDGHYPQPDLIEWLTALGTQPRYGQRPAATNPPADIPPRPRSR